MALASIRELRTLHVELDTAVLGAYGWHQPGPDGTAIDLGHDFHDVETLPENDRVRYTISAAARRELLARLLKENHRRAAAEESTSTAPVKPKRTKGSSKGEDNLFAQ